MSVFPFKRDLSKLQDREFDVLVIGGGIYGAWTAYDAVTRGLSVALVEQTDWGAGTSSASSKLIHGGLRYLEHYEFGLVRHALKERRTLYRMAPHLVRPLNFVFPMWKSGRVSPMLVGAGLVLYDLLAYGNQPVPPHKRHSQRDLLARYPFVQAEGLRSGFRYGDCQEDDARLNLLVAATAQSNGAVCVNRVRAESLLEEDGRVCGAVLHDRVGDSRFEVRAKTVVNAAGPWMAELLGEQAPPIRLIKGSHLILPAIPGCNEAFLLTAADGRVFFVIPWYGRTLVGTTESEVTDPASAEATDEECRYLLAAVREHLPGLGWTEADVIGRFAGVRMLQAGEASSLSAVSREFEVQHPKPGLLMYVGGKYTTARSDSIEIVDAVFESLQMRTPPSVTDRYRLSGAPDGVFETWQAGAIAQLAEAGVDLEAARWLTLRHGTGIQAIIALIQERPEWAQRIHPEAPFIAAEAVHAVRAEMAGSLEDVARRRMPLSLLVRDQAWREPLQTILQDELSNVS